MKRFLAVALGMGLMIVTASAQDKKGASKSAPALKDTKQKVSYGIGLNIGRSMKTQGVEVDSDLLARGIKDALAGGKALLTDQELKEAMLALQQEFQAKQAGASKAIGEKNKKDGDAFLAANTKKAGVKTLPSGLQYKVVKEGTGHPQGDRPGLGPLPRHPHRRHRVRQLGEEWSADSDRSQRGDPRLDRGLEVDEGGVEVELFIPGDLAYGPNPRPGGPIGPNATLLFDIELLGIEKQ